MLNALCHKKYESGVPIQVSVYDNRLYIANCGSLPEDWTAESLMQKHVSRPYNTAVAHVFYLAGYIENRGRGVEKICRACEEDGVPQPEYTVHPGDIMIKFSAPENRVIRVTDRVTDNERKILILLSEDPGYTMMDMSNTLSVSRKTVARCLKSLNEKGYIERVGTDRKGYWNLKI